MVDMFTRLDAQQSLYLDYVFDCEDQGKEPISFDEFAANGYRSQKPMPVFPVKFPDFE